MTKLNQRWAAVCRFGGCGDNLVAASVLRPLKALGYNVEVITTKKGSNTHTVFLNNPFIDKLTLKDDGEIPGGGLPWQQWFATRAGEYDIFANLSHSMEYHHSFFISQTQFWWPPEVRRKIAAGSYLETVHDIVGVPHTWGPLFFPTDEEKDRAEKTKKEVGGRYLSWVISGSRIDKIYSAGPLVIARVIRELGIPVVLCGVGGKQFEMAKQIMEFVEHHNSSNKGLHLALSPDTADPGGHQHWSLRRTLTQTMLGDAVVTPDTGGWWATAMEDVPKVLMLSHASVENIAKHAVRTIALSADRYRVPCFPCHRLHDSIETCRPNKDGNGAACISDLSVECALTAIKAALGSHSSMQTLQQQWASNVTMVGWPASNVVPLKEVA